MAASVRLYDISGKFIKINLDWTEEVPLLSLKRAKSSQSAL